VHVSCNANNVEIGKADIRFLTRCPGSAAELRQDSRELDEAMQMSPLVFEPLRDTTDTISLNQDHNEIAFYTWSDRRCCLPRGATSATLANNLTKLKAGDALLFEEVLGPRTGDRADADSTHRHVVRLTSVAGGTDPLTGAGTTEIAWAAEDALPFPLC